MTNAIVKENKISFKTLEKKIFEEVCKLAREHAKIILENYDDILSKERDTSKYRNKGKRKTSIKTVYGDVKLFYRTDHKCWRCMEYSPEAWPEDNIRGRT